MQDLRHRPPQLTQTMIPLSNFLQSSNILPHRPLTRKNRRTHHLLDQIYYPPQAPWIHPHQVLVPHDDDSAVVDRVRTGLGTELETLWGCCGRTVDGDGDQGPPDGWCYEGRHTVCIHVLSTV